jgi:hypothetical protein
VIYRFTQNKLRERQQLSLSDSIFPFTKGVDRSVKDGQTHSLFPAVPGVQLVPLLRAIERRFMPGRSGSAMPKVRKHRDYSIAGNSEERNKLPNKIISLTSNNKTIPMLHC